jgi:hypothetical protein
MKRKEPTGTAAEDEEQGEEHAVNFLSALPDLALSAVLDFLQEGATLRIDGM